MRAACALRIFSGRMIFNFGIPERLRTLRYPLFYGRGQATEEVFSHAKGLLHSLCSSPLFMLLSGGQSAAQISFFRVSPMM